MRGINPLIDNSYSAVTSLSSSAQFLKLSELSFAAPTCGIRPFE